MRNFPRRERCQPQNKRILKPKGKKGELVHDNKLSVNCSPHPEELKIGVSGGCQLFPWFEGKWWTTAQLHWEVGCSVYLCLQHLAWCLTSLLGLRSPPFSRDPQPLSENYSVFCNQICLESLDSYPLSRIVCSLHLPPCERNRKWEGRKVMRCPSRNGIQGGHADMILLLLTIQCSSKLQGWVLSQPGESV